MSARCDLTELLPADGAHCRKLPGPFAEPKPASRGDGTLGSPFSAHFRGKCGHCGDPFLRGDTIRADGAGSYIALCCDPDGDNRA